MLTFILIAIVVVVLYFAIWKLFFKPTVKNSYLTKETESKFKFSDSSKRIEKVRIKGRFSRKVIRFNTRRLKGYIWGQIGLSRVSKLIKRDFTVILNRKIRKRYTKHFGIPFVVYRGN